MRYLKLLSSTSYFSRVALIWGALVVLTIAAIAFAPRIDSVHFLAQSPNGADIALDTPVSITFSRPVDRLSAERAFLIYPIVTGRFEWRDQQTLVFYPTELLLPNTMYVVMIRPGLRDTRGYVNHAPTTWPFRTADVAPTTP